MEVSFLDVLLLEAVRFVTGAVIFLAGVWVGQRFGNGPQRTGEESLESFRRSLRIRRTSEENGYD